MLTIYEAIILFKTVPKDELAVCMKRAAGFIFDKGGFLRNLHYMGLQKCPYRQSKNKMPFWEAHYTYFEFQAPKIKIPLIYNDMQRDVDIIKHSFVPTKYPPEPMNFEDCTFEEEMANVPDRPQVKKYIELARNRKESKDRRKMKLNTNLSYFPFQR